MPPKHREYPSLFFALGQSTGSAGPTARVNPAITAIVDACDKQAFAAAMLLLEATPGLLDEVLDDRRCWGLVDHPRFAAVYPEAAEQMIAARALREGFEASLCR